MVLIMISCTFQQIETFLIVAERLNFTDAAEAMYLSQSALSKMISRLEASLGTKLFIRENRGVSLTKEGQRLYDSLKKSYNAITRALEDAQTLKPPCGGTLHLGCPSMYDYNSSYNIVKQAISDFSQTHPDIEISETIYEFEQQKNALMSGEVDLIITQSSHAKLMKDASFLKLAPLDTCILMSTAHRLAKYAVLPIDEMQHETFYELLIGNSIKVEENARSICKVLGFSPKAVKTVPNMPSLIRTIDAGKGISLCERIDKTPADVSIKCYPVHPHHSFTGQHIMVAWRTGELHAKAESLIYTLKEAIADTQQ